MKIRQVLLFSRDPGGANQMIAVFRLLMADRQCAAAPDDPAMREFLDQLRQRGTLPQPLVYTKRYANRQWADAGFDSRSWRDPDDLPAWLAANNVVAVVTGTSDVDDETDQALWRAAAETGVLSFAFLDHASNPACRFRSGDGALVHPGTIFLHDAETRESLIAAGIPARHLRVTGNLFINALEPAADDIVCRQRLRRGWRLGDDDAVILFASEPVAEARSLGRRVAYDEFEAIDRVIRAIENCESFPALDGAERKATLVIRAHPRDRQGKYRRIAESAPVPVLICDQGPARDAILAADLVVGMDSSLLAEAQQLNVPALSLIADSSFARLRGGPFDPDIGRRK